MLRRGCKLTIARYGSGKASALVIDVGHYNTSVSAVWEGTILKKSKSCILLLTFVERLREHDLMDKLQAYFAHL